MRIFGRRPDKELLTGRCNTICGNVDLRGGVYGTNRAPRLAPEQMAELWQRWKAGQSMNGTSVHNVVRCRGGIAPVVRRRSRLALTLVEREDISRGIAVGWSIRRQPEA